MKLFYMIYFAGIAIFVLNSVSAVLFKKTPLWKKARRVCSAVFFSVVWPLAIFSEEGRKVIIKRTINL